MNAIPDKKSAQDQIAFCMNAIAAGTTRPFPYFHLAALRLQDGSLFAARAMCEQALSLRPTYAEAWFLLGQIAEAQKDSAWAEEAYYKAITFAPLFEQARSRVRALLGDAEVEHVQSANWPQVTYHGPQEWVLDSSDDEAALRELIAREGFNPKRLIKLAVILEADNRALEAQCFAHYVLLCDPKNSNALLLLSNLARVGGDHELALKLALDAAEAMPGHPIAANAAMTVALNACAWDRYFVLLERAQKAASLFPGTAEPVETLLYLSDPFAQAAVARAWGAKYIAHRASVSLSATKVEPAARKPKKITVGYLSADFHPHPIGRLISELLRHHDRSEFVLRAYATWPAPENEIQSAVRQHVDSFDGFYGATATEAAQKVAADNVDILVDLAGYTLNNRVDILAQQPAPLQVGYAGYLGTMSVPFIQYQIVDTTIAADPQALAFQESLVRLPFSILAGDRHRFVKLVAPVTRDQLGLPLTSLVFCNFSLSNRLNPNTFDVWIRILKRVPNSVLWLAINGQERMDRIRAYAFSNGLDPSRIIFNERTSYDDYLQRFTCADLFLDTLPQNAGAVANDALWMGCPVLTCMGVGMQGRVGAGMVRAAGVPELVTDSMLDYENLAVRLGNNPAELKELQKRLRDGRDRHPMFDPQQMMRSLEDAYRVMWRLHSDGLPPTQIDISR